MNPEFMEMIRHMKESGIFTVGTMSNGFKSTQFYLDALDYLDGLVLSYQMEFTKRESYMRKVTAIFEKIQKIN